MNWTEKCNDCAKSGHLINQGIKFACFDSECHYEPIEIPEESVTTSCSVWIEMPHNDIESQQPDD